MAFMNHISLAFGVAFDPMNLLFCFVGVFIGTFIGVLPGLGLSEPNNGFLGIYAPGGLSQDIAAVLTKGFEKAVKDPGYVDLVKNRYFMSPDYMNAVELNKAALADDAMMEKIKASSK